MKGVGKIIGSLMEGAKGFAAVKTAKVGGKLGAKALVDFLRGTLKRPDLVRGMIEHAKAAENAVDFVGAMNTIDVAKFLQKAGVNANTAATIHSMFNTTVDRFGSELFEELRRADEAGAIDYWSKKVDGGVDAATPADEVMTVVLGGLLIGHRVSASDDCPHCKQLLAEINGGIPKEREILLQGQQRTTRQNQKGQNASVQATSNFQKLTVDPAALQTGTMPLDVALDREDLLWCPYCWPIIAKAVSAKNKAKAGGGAGSTSGFAGIFTAERPKVLKVIAAVLAAHPGERTWIDQCEQVKGAKVEHLRLILAAIDDDDVVDLPTAEAAILLSAGHASLHERAYDAFTRSMDRLDTFVRGGVETIRVNAEPMWVRVRPWLTWSVGIGIALFVLGWALWGAGVVFGASWALIAGFITATVATLAYGYGATAVVSLLVDVAAVAAAPVRAVAEAVHAGLRMAGLTPETAKVRTGATKEQRVRAVQNTANALVVLQATFTGLMLLPTLVYPHLFSGIAEWVNGMNPAYGFAAVGADRDGELAATSRWMFTAAMVLTVAYARHVVSYIHSVAFNEVDRWRIATLGLGTAKSLRLLAKALVLAGILLVPVANAIAFSGKVDFPTWGKGSSADSDDTNPTESGGHNTQGGYRASTTTVVVSQPARSAEECCHLSQELRKKLEANVVALNEALRK